MIEVRKITADEVPAQVAAVYAGFHHGVHEDSAEYFRPRLDLDRSYAAFDGADVVGTTETFATGLTVPGGSILPASAVTNVTVLATHRRQGILTRMMDRQLRDDAARNESVAILIAAEAPIYGRFGYGPATEAVGLEVDTRLAEFTAPPKPGSIRRVPPAQLVEEGPALYERFRTIQVGSIERPTAWWWDSHLINRPPGHDKPEGQEFCVVHRDDDGVTDGFARYRVKTDWDYRMPRALLQIDDLVAITDAAYVALWHHCTTVDWVTKVEAYDRPVVEALPSLLSNRRAARPKDRSDYMWARILDPLVALSSRRYRVADRIVVSVIDPGGFAAGRYAIEGGPDGAACTVATSAADLTMSAADLGAAFLGGTVLWPAVVAGRVEEHRPGAVAAFDRMFGSDVPPWCNTDF